MEALSKDKMKEAVLQLIAGGSIDLAREIITSLDIPFNVKEEARKTSRENPYTIRFWRHNLQVKIKYFKVTNSVNKRGHKLWEQEVAKFNNYYEALSFALTWKGGKQ